MTEQSNQESNSISLCGINFPCIKTKKKITDTLSKKILLGVLVGGVVGGVVVVTLLKMSQSQDNEIDYSEMYEEAYGCLELKCSNLGANIFKDLFNRNEYLENLQHYVKRNITEISNDVNYCYKGIPDANVKNLEKKCMNDIVDMVKHLYNTYFVRCIENYCSNKIEGLFKKFINLYFKYLDNNVSSYCYDVNREYIISKYYNKLSNLISNQVDSINTGFNTFILTSVDVCYKFFPSTSIEKVTAISICNDFIQKIVEPC